jgi:hypothetical protein
MPTTTFKITPQSDGTFTVEMTTARGNPRTFPAFGSESEARAWIVQTERLLDQANPRLPPPPGLKPDRL